MPRLLGGKVSTIIDCSTAASPPPAAPWITRARISVPRFGAMPQASEATVKRATEIM